MMTIIKIYLLAASWLALDAVGLQLHNTNYTAFLAAGGTDGTVQLGREDNLVYDVDDVGSFLQQRQQDPSCPPGTHQTGISVDGGKTFTKTCVADTAYSRTNVHATSTIRCPPGALAVGQECWTTRPKNDGTGEFIIDKQVQPLTAETAQRGKLAEEDAARALQDENDSREWEDAMKVARARQEELPNNEAGDDSALTPQAVEKEHSCTGRLLGYAHCRCMHTDETSREASSVELPEGEYATAQGADKLSGPDKSLCPVTAHIGSLCTSVDEKHGECRFFCGEGKLGHSWTAHIHQHCYCMEMVEDQKQPGGASRVLPDSRNSCDGKYMNQGCAGPSGTAKGMCRSKVSLFPSPDEVCSETVKVLGVIVDFTLRHGAKAVGKEVGLSKPPPLSKLAMMTIDSGHEQHAGGLNTVNDVTTNLWGIARQELEQHHASPLLIQLLHTAVISAGAFLQIAVFHAVPGLAIILAVYQVFDFFCTDAYTKEEVEERQRLAPDNLALKLDKKIHDSVCGFYVERIKQSKAFERFLTGVKLGNEFLTKEFVMDLVSNLGELWQKVTNAVATGHILIPSALTWAFTFVIDHVGKIVGEFHSVNGMVVKFMEFFAKRAAFAAIWRIVSQKSFGLLKKTLGMALHGSASALRLAACEDNVDKIFPEWKKTAEEIVRGEGQR
ncbi:unnamed protein product [Amoebophrya sp. A25]|nr:unnamed protein product [Amoebophrya sp. A25]|eukprot:GSA25T00012379001.1